MDQDTTEDAPEKPLWILGIKALTTALVATLLVRVLALVLFDIPQEFPPLAVAGPTFIFTVGCTLGAIGVWGVMRRRVDRPEHAFRRLALVVLLVSFVPDLWLLTDGAATAFPGATVPAVGALMLMHVVAAAAIVWSLTGAIFAQS